MSHEPALEQAIQQFTTWDRPATFCDTVTANLTDEAKSFFDLVWKEALSTEHWKYTDLQECTHAAEKKLSERFPDLSTEALKAIVTAAAYQWR